MTAQPNSKYAVSFVFITVFLDMVGFGLIMPVLPKLITSVGQISVADAAGVLTGPAEKHFGASNVVLIGLLSAVIAVIGYGLAPGHRCGGHPVYRAWPGRLRAPDVAMYLAAGVLALTLLIFMRVRT